MGWGDPAFYEDWAVPRGEAYLVESSNTWILHPADMLLQLGRGRLPFESRFNLGIRELERDRRRYA